MNMMPIQISSTDLLAHKAMKLKRKEIVLDRTQIDGRAHASDKEEWVICCGTLSDVIVCVILQVIYFRKYE